jgi:hypothetical protein
MNTVAGARGLVISLVIAVATSLVWIWWVADHQDPPVSVVAVGDVAQAANQASYQLVGLTISDSLTSEWGQAIEPVDGAVFVTARVRFDTRSANDAGLCTFYLGAGRARWRSETYSPPPPEVSFCTAGTTGIVTTTYQVPRAMVGQIDGLLVVQTNGAWLQLRGQAS